MLGTLEDARRKLDQVTGSGGSGEAPIPTPLTRNEAPDGVKAVSEAGIKVPADPKLTDPQLAGKGVDWKDESLTFRQKVSDALNAMPEALRDKVSIESGYRTNAEQAEIYARSGQGVRFMAAPPGKSMHERGVAADVKFADPKAEKAFREAAASAGLVFPFPDRDPNHMQLDGVQKLATQETVDRKRVGTLEDAQAVLDHITSGRSSSTLAEDEPDMDEALVDPLDQSPSDTSTPTLAFLAGAASGSVNTVAGPVQVGLQIVDRDRAVQFTNQMNDWEERLGMLEQARRSPVAFGAGEAVGTVSSILAGGGVLGATRAGELVGQAMSYLPRIARGAATGFAAGATTFHRDLDEANRWLEGTFGAILGAGGQTVARSYTWAKQYLAKVEEVQGLVETLKASVGEVTKNVNSVKQTVLDHYRGVTEQANEKYAIREAAGEGFGGYDPEILAQALRDVEARSGRAGVATVVTQGAVKDEMGIDAYEAAKAAHGRSVEAYREGEAAWQKAADKLGLKGLAPAVREKIIQEMAHALPERPIDPGPFVPRVISPMQYAAGRQVVNRSIQKAERSGDIQAQGQLRIMKQHLTAAAAQDAERSGIPAAVFQRKMDEADRFFAENVGPIRDFFGRVTPQQMEDARKFTTAKMWDKVSKVIKANDVEDMELLGKAMGPNAKLAMTQVVEKEMLDTLTAGMKGRSPVTGAPERFAKYINDRKEGLIAMVGRQRVEELEGFANMAQQMVTERRVSRLWGWSTHSFLPFIGAEQIIEGVVEGQPHKIQRGVGLVAAPFAVHALHNVFVRLHDLPYVMPMIRQAGKVKPGTPEFDKLMRQIEARVVGATGIAARTGVQELGTLTELPR